jgi:hypothetical protein
MGTGAPGGRPAHFEPRRLAAVNGTIDWGDVALS